MKERTVYYIVALEWGCREDYGYDMRFDDIDGDYIVYAIYDLETDRFLYHDDNTHSPYGYEILQGFAQGVEVMGGKVKVENAVLYMAENESAYNSSDIRLAIDRYLKGVRHWEDMGGE